MIKIIVATIALVLKYEDIIMKLYNNKKKINLIVIIGTILIQISAGSFYTWAIFNNGLMLKTGGKKSLVDGVVKISGGLPAGSVSFTFTVGMLALSLATLAGIPLAKRYGIKLVSMIASIIYGLSIMSLATINTNSSIWTLWGIGILLGSMNGILYLTTLTNAIKWFPNQKGLISGISVAAYGLGSFIFKYIDQIISEGEIDASNISRVFILWGVIALILSFLGSLLLKDAPVDSHQKNSENTDNDFSTREMLHTKQVYMLFLCLTTAVMFMGLLGSAVTNMASLETQNVNNVAVWGGTVSAATFVAVVALMNTIGRFILGWLSDIIGRRNIFFITYTLQLIALVILILTKPGTMPMNVMYLIIITLAFCFGGNITVFPTYVAELFGLKYSAQNYSVIYQAFGLGAIIVGFLLASGFPTNPVKVTYSNGAILTQNFNLVYWVLAIFVVISLLMFATIKKPTRM